MLLLYALVIALRMPQIVLKSRFWAEEGTIFFVNAWTLSPMQALLTPVGGYLNIVATASTLAARWCVGIEFAPYVTIGVAVLFQLCPPLLLLLARDAWLQNRLVRLGGVLLLLLVPAAEEIWLQTLHCQFELALCAGLLLALAVPTGGRAVFGAGLLLLAPLCGPVAIALLPLFALRAVLERSRGRAWQTAALASGSAVQLLLFFTLDRQRAFGIDPAVLLSVVTVKHLAVPFLGISKAGWIAAGLRATLASEQVPWGAVAAPLLAVAALAAMILISRVWTAAWLLAGAALLGGAAYVGALDGAPALIHEFAGERYAFVPQSLLSICLLALAASGSRRVRLLAAALCVWLLVIGQEQFRHPWRVAADGPSWRGEVALWRENPRYVLQIWPPGWTILLNVTTIAKGTNSVSD